AVALAIVLLTQVPWTGPRSAVPPAAPAGATLTFRTDATAAEIRDAGAELLESYGAYRVARGPAASVGDLALRGRHAETLDLASVLELLNGPIDIATLASRRPAWTLDSSGHAIGVVHFHAPIKAEWRPLLEVRGVGVLRYLPPDAFVVRGSPAERDGVLCLRFVDWAGWCR